MTNKQALREEAESAIGILENIAGFEPSDIDGDVVELRFETEGGFDTGCDVSIVEQCQKSVDVIRALLDELEAKDRRNAELNSTLERWAVDRAQSASELEAAEKRVAELEANNDSATEALLKARRRAVTLPTGYSVRPGHPINETERGVMIPKDNGPWLSRHDVEHALRVAGIRINGEG